MNIITIHMKTVMNNCTDAEEYTIGMDQNGLLLTRICHLNSDGIEDSFF